MKSLRPMAALAALLLAACHGQQQAGSPAPPAPAAATPTPEVFTDKALGLSIRIPDGMTLRHDFQRSYLDAGAWQAFAGDNGKGRPLAALVLKHSDKVTAAELRISESANADALAHCEDVPASAQPGSVSSRSLDGVNFQQFRAGDAAMSHYLQVEGYRAIRQGQCVAIDLLVFGTRPEVYDPPRQPPFSQDEAWRALHAALDGVHWSG